MNQFSGTRHFAGRGKGRDGSLMPLLGFVLLCVSMFVNLILAFLHARGLPASANIVIAVQALVTAFALPAFLSRTTKFTGVAVAALSFIAFSALVTNIINPLNFKSVYDSILIPIYIALGMAASQLRTKWMNYLLLFVVATVVLEILFPSIYVRLFNPADYLSATREWVAVQKANAAVNDGLYSGSYRSGGSQFSFTDHRIGGAFLEPLSLGYFAFLMSTYYAGLYRGPLYWRMAALVLCFGLTLSSDSRVATALVVLSALFLSLRLRLPAITLWAIFPVVIAAIYFLYSGHFSFLYGDTFYRMGITFDSLARVNLGQMLIGSVPLDRVGDSGILYMMRCVGFVGMPVAIWFYSGAFTRRSGTSVAFFTLIAVYLTVTLMFGGASLSIKTASLLGYLIGIAGRSSSTAISRSSRGSVYLGDEEPGAILAVHFKAIFKSVRRNAWLITAIVSALIALGVIATMLMPPKYQATAQIVIEDRVDQIIQGRDLRQPAGAKDADRYLQTRLDILESRALADAVVQDGRFDRDARFFKAFGRALPVGSV